MTNIEDPLGNIVQEKQAVCPVNKEILAVHVEPALNPQYALKVRKRARDAQKRLRCNHQNGQQVD